MLPTAAIREVPGPLAALRDLVLDLRWMWSHKGDALWRALAPEAWEITRNPWLILQDVSDARLEDVAFGCPVQPVS